MFKNKIKLAIAAVVMCASCGYGMKENIFAERFNRAFQNNDQTILMEYYLEASKAAQNNRVETFIHFKKNQILEKIIQIDKQRRTEYNEQKETLLMLSARRGSVDCIPYLLSELRMQEFHGYSALMYAASSGKPDCIKLLLSELGMQDKCSKTALMHCSKCDPIQFDTMKLLLGEIGIRTCLGSTPLMHYVRGAKNLHTDDSKQLIEYLMDASTYEENLEALHLESEIGKTIPINVVQKKIDLYDDLKDQITVTKKEIVDLQKRRAAVIIENLQTQTKKILENLSAIENENKAIVSVLLRSMGIE